MPNRLATETSPYLLQHRDNPVDWHPWDQEALEKARREQKPIFLSIGYSACHWCHVMEHESFENERIAALINESFVPIKVDREERPDLDQIYMNAVQMLTGHGGWPMSVFLTPDLKPFYAGTYWPPTSSRGMPGFDQILAAVADAWKKRREEAVASAERLTEELQKIGRMPAGDSKDGDALDQRRDVLSGDLLRAAAQEMCSALDTVNGGFGSAPKFPHPMALRFLLRAHHRQPSDSLLDLVRLTLDRMAAGGIYDHLGGGFARYSVDARWLVPHFEKMLYDNALLAGAYLEVFQATGEERYRAVVRETLDYILRDMTDPAGGFYSTEDADSEGEEGIFYTWTPAEIEAVLGPERCERFCHVYDVSEDGNFEGRNVLNLRKSLSQWADLLQVDEASLTAELADSRAKLLAAREGRVRPGRDDKVIVAWNGLMIDAMARAGAALGEPRYVEAASAAADFLLSKLRRPDGRLLHTWRGGEAKLDAYLDDYACLANALVSLYEATFDERRIQQAVELADTILQRFADPEEGGFFYTADDHEQLIARSKEVTDASTPSGNGMAAIVLLRLGKLLGRSDYLDAAGRTMLLSERLIRRAPLAVGQILLAADFDVGPTHELALVGDTSREDMRQAIEILGRSFLPRAVIASRSGKNGAPGGGESAVEELFAGKTSPDGQPVLYVCQEFTCHEPVKGADAIAARIGELTSSA